MCWIRNVGAESRWEGFFFFLISCYIYQVLTFLLILCRMQFAFSTWLVLFGVFPEVAWNIIIVLCACLWLCKYKSLIILLYSKPHLSNLHSRHCCILMSVCEATRNNTHIVSRCCGKVGERRSVKWDWLHRVKCGDCGTGRNMNLLRKRVGYYKLPWKEVQNC